MRSLILQNKAQFAYRAMGLALIPLLTCLLLISIYGYTIPNKAAPHAQEGILDLSRWDFEKDGFVNLDGEWVFYPNELLASDDFQSGKAARLSASYADIPNFWFGGDITDRASQAKLGTYRLVVKVNGSQGNFGFRVSDVQMAHRLFVNGTLLGHAGNPAPDVQSYKPGSTPYSTYTRIEGNEMEVLLQVANLYSPNTGGFRDLQFGLQADILRADHIWFAVEVTGLFILLLFGAYHISIFTLRPKDKAYLFSSLYFLTLLMLIMGDGNKLILQLLPGISSEWVLKLAYFGAFSNIAVLGFFLHYLDVKLLSRKLLLLLVFPLGAYLAAVLVFPFDMYSKLGNIPWHYLTVLVVFYLYRAIRLYFKQDGQIDRKEAALLIGVILAMVSIRFVSLFYRISLVESDMGRRVAFICIIVFMNLLIAIRLVQATRRTEQLTEELIVRDKLKDEFLANTSHELKTPLHGIQNMASYLLDGKAGELTASQRSELTLIQDTSIKLTALVNDLLDVVRLKHGDLQLERSVVDLRVAAEMSFQVLEFELAGKDVRWENRIAPGTYALADENRVRQVLYNLIHNAIKHTKIGRIEISAAAADGRVTVWVEDTGIGIPQDSHESIFGYFEQSEGVISNDGYTGMGLGLYISRQLIEKMNGTIRVERSEPGHGTRMVFTLPLAENPLDESLHRLRSPGIRRAALSAGQAQFDIVDPSRTNTVLLVDDEASNIRILLKLLGDEYNVLTALSAKEALLRLNADPSIDLVILDVMMPETSGIDLCRTIRETRSVVDLPVLFSTVKNSLYDIELCFRAGGNDFIAKPFDPKTLSARVRTLISMKTSMDRAIRNELAFLQAQIKPHFLYNAISSIISFCYTDGEKAAYLLSMLSRYLRTVFQRDLLSLYVPLSAELELIQAYVEIEKARFGDRLIFQLFQDAGLGSVTIPSLTIQPLVENAIRHGLFEKEGIGTVSLSITEGHGYFRFDIADDGVGMADDLLYLLKAGEQPTGSGIGLANVRRRLAALPGASVTIDSALEKGTRVTVYLPKREVEAAAAGS